MVSDGKTKHEESTRHVDLWIFKVRTRESYSEFSTSQTIRAAVTATESMVLRFG